MQVVYKCRNCGVTFQTKMENHLTDDSTTRDTALAYSSPNQYHDCDPGITGMCDLIAVTQFESAVPLRAPTDAGPP